MTTEPDPTNADENDAWKDGYEAYLKEHQLTDNPFNPTNQERLHILWAQGWESAEDDYT